MKQDENEVTCEEVQQLKEELKALSASAKEKLLANIALFKAGYEIGFNEARTATG